MSLSASPSSGEEAATEEVARRQARAHRAIGFGVAIFTLVGGLLLVDGMVLLQGALTGSFFNVPLTALLTFGFAFAVAWCQGRLAKELVGRLRLPKWLEEASRAHHVGRASLRETFDLLGASQSFGLLPALVLAGLSALAVVGVVVGPPLWLESAFETEGVKPFVLGPEPRQLPSLPEPEQIEPGVWLYELEHRLGEGREKIWIYRPALPDAPGFDPGATPLVVIPPFGASLIEGVRLESFHRDGHLPFVRAGLVVVSFSIPGAPSPDMAAGVGRFMRAQAGLRDLHRARALALARLEEVDPEAVFVAGELDAASLAILYAEYAPVAGVVALLPEWTRPVSAELRRDVRLTRGLAPGLMDFVVNRLPRTRLERLGAPVALGAMPEVEPESAAVMRDFAAELEATGVGVSLFSAIDDGDAVEQSLAWIRARTAQRAPK